MAPFVPYGSGMDRRAFLAALAVLLSPPALARAPPFRLALLGGEPDGDGFIAGVAVELDTGWKTYWRLPGESGIPPVFDFSKSQNAGATEVLYPVPQRFRDASGETIGFAHRVVFPLRITPADPALPVRLEVSMFLGVCKDVCIPVNGRLSLDLSYRSADPEAQRELSEWLARVPAQRKIVKAARIDGNDLRVKLAEPVEDIFVESATSAYFRAPRFSAGGLEATLAVDGMDNPSQMKGQTLTFTLRRGEGGFEQTVTAD